MCEGDDGYLEEVYRSICYGGRLGNHGNVCTTLYNWRMNNGGSLNGVHIRA